MNEEQLKTNIEERWGRHGRRSRRSRVWAGLFLLVIGGLLLLKTLNVFFFPVWFFSWPVILIAAGFFIGARHGFRSGFWVIPILIGGLLLWNRYDPTMRIDRFIAPAVIIAIGLMFILKPRRHRWHGWRGRYGADWQEAEAIESTTCSFDASQGASTGDRRDFVDVTAVFGGVKKNILSKSFKGGDIVSFMGGSEINMTQADFTGRITIDATNIFGGTKLIVPPTWDVQSDVTAIFGGVDDKRQIGGANMDPNKVLVLDGVCLFGGIEIRSF